MDSVVRCAQLRAAQARSRSDLLRSTRSGRLRLIAPHYYRSIYRFVRLISDLVWLFPDLFPLTLS